MKNRGLALAVMLTCLISGPGYGETRQPGLKGGKMTTGKVLTMKPIGQVKKQDDRTWLEIKPEFAPALLGLGEFSHVWVIYWFDGNDTPEARATLQVHPRRDPANPLTGVFACRSPQRPNLIGLTACKILQIKGNRVEVAGLDAWDGTPLVDLKPYIPKGDAIPEATTPDWVNRLRRASQE